MRLCIIANPNSIHVRRWVRHFQRRGFDVHLIGAKPRIEAVPAGITFHDSMTFPAIPGVQYLAAARKTRQIVNQIQPDVIHAHFVDGGGWLAAATGFHPFILTAHGSDLLSLSTQSLAFRQLSQWALNCADYVTCVSKQLYSTALSLGVDASKVELLPMGVDLDLFHPHGDAAEQPDLTKGRTGPLITNLRAIKSIYNPHDFARAIPLVLKNVPDARFAIFKAGADPELLAEFQSIVTQHGASNSVHYIERVEDNKMAALLRDSTVAVSIASSDGTPMSVQEAMACGTPLILGKIPSFDGWITNNNNALLIPLHNPDELSKAIVRLLGNTQLRKELSYQGLSFIRTHANRAKLMQRVEDLYRDFANEDFNASKRDG